MINWIAKWPGHPAMTVVVQILILGTGATVIGHMMQGHIMPSGYGEWFIFLGALAGVNVGAMGVRRTTDHEYQRIKNQGKPTVGIESETTNVTATEQKG